MSKTLCFSLVASLCLSQGQLAFAQDGSDLTDMAALSQDFLTEQQSLAQSFNLLVSQGATAQQIAAWQTQNASRLADQQQRALFLGAYSEAQPLNYIYEVAVVPGATQAMNDFLVAQADLYNRFVQLHNQALADSGEATVSDGDVQAAFQQQNAAEIQAQAQRSQVLTAQSASQPLPVPPPLVVPPGTSSIMAAFLVFRDQLTRERIALWNQYLTVPAATRDAAIQQWQKQNVARIQQLQQLAQQLSQSGG